MLHYMTRKRGNSMLNKDLQKEIDKLIDLQKKYFSIQYNNDINYYTKELGRQNITDVYRNNCQFKLDQAIKKAAELAKELDKLLS